MKMPQKSSLLQGRQRSTRLAAALLVGATMATAMSAITPTAQAATKAPTKDIVDTAVGAGDFGTLAAALQAAGLVDTLKGKGPFTVFAPTDAA